MKNMEKKNWFNKKIEEVEKELNTNSEKGLEQEQIQKIRNEKGYNELQAAKKKTIIVDCNLRKKQDIEEFNIKNEKGL